MTISGLRRVLGLPEVAFIAIGFTIGGGVFVLTGVVYYDLKSLAKVGWFGTFILSGIFFYHWRRRHLLRRGIDVGTLKGKDDWD